LSEFNNTEILQISEKYLNIILHENPFSGSQVVPRGWTDRQTDMMKLTVTFCSYVNVSKNGNNYIPSMRK